MGTLSLFSFGSPALGSDFFPPFGTDTEPREIYPEVKIEMDGSVLASSFFVSGILTRYDFPTSFNDLSGRQLRIHYLNDFSAGSALSVSGVDNPPLAFANASAGEIEGRILFLVGILFNTGGGFLAFDWSLGNFIRASNAPSSALAPKGFTRINEASIAISMSNFVSGTNIQLKTNTGGQVVASVGAMWINGFLEFKF